MNLPIRAAKGDARRTRRATRILFSALIVATVAAALIARADPPQGAIVGWGSQVVGVDLSSGFIAVVTGYQHSLGLTADGSIVAWGANYFGQSSVLLPNADFIAVSAGGFHSLGLKGDGSIVAWGNNGYGETNVSAPNSGFIAAGAGHSLAIRRKVTDDDGDGVLDADDLCPNSDVGETLVIDKCDTGIPNDVSDDGCTRADAVVACAEEARNQGQFVQCVAHLANGWKRSGTIANTDHGRIMRCTARADIPPPDDEQTIGSNRAASRPDRALQRSNTQQSLPLSDTKNGIQKDPGQLSRNADSFTLP